MLKYVTSQYGMGKDVIKMDSVRWITDIFCWFDHNIFMPEFTSRWLIAWILWVPVTFILTFKAHDIVHIVGYVFRSTVPWWAEEHPISPVCSSFIPVFFLFLDLDIDSSDKCAIIGGMGITVLWSLVIKKLGLWITGDKFFRWLCDEYEGLVCVTGLTLWFVSLFAGSQVIGGELISDVYIAITVMAGIRLLITIAKMVYNGFGTYGVGFALYIMLDTVLPVMTLLKVIN